jgi:nucleotide-binding universal stress UspA family protein
MIRVNKILVGYDFSKGADRALVEAARIARKTDATVIIACVEVMHRDLQSMETNAATRSEKLHQQLEERWKSLNGEAAGLFDALKTEYSVLRDVAAAPALLQFADDEGIDLIVVGTHGRRGLRRMLMGSVAEEIVRKAPCTVLTARHHDVKLGDDFHRTILAPVDFSSHSLRALRHARAIADLFDHDLLVLHVLEERLHPAFYNTGMFSQYDFDPDIEDRTKAELARFYQAAGGPEVRTDYAVRRGHAVKEIVQAARESDPSMIVMATHGLTGLDHFLMGSVAEKVVRHAESPVVTIKSFGRRLVEDPLVEAYKDYTESTKSNDA